MKSLTLLLLGAWFIPLANLLQAQSVDFFNEYVNQPSVWRPAKPIAPGVGPDGDLNLSLPVLAIPGRNGLGYTVQLSYRSSIKGTQEASWIGLGWSFDPGSITRDVQGGVIFPHDTITREGPVDVYSVDYEEQEPLYQPDLYYVTTPAGSFSMTRVTVSGVPRPGSPTNGVFFPDKWRPWQISYGTPQQVTVNDPLVGSYSTKSFHNVPGTGIIQDNEVDIPNFTLTAEDGTRYIFEHPTLATYVLNLPSEQAVAWYLQHYVSTWRLAAILGPDYPGGGVGDLPDPEGNPSDNTKPGSWVRFYYDDVRITKPKTDPNIVHTGIEDLFDATPQDRHRTRQVTYLRSVHTPTHRAELEVDARPEQHDDTYIWEWDILKRFKRLELYAKGSPDQLVSAVELVHSDTLRGLSPPNTGFERRMALTAIKFFDSNNSEEPGYTFDYISAYDVTTYNDLLSSNRDDFGYFNEVDRTGGSYVFGPTDSGANNDGTAWSLKTVTYPTGSQADIFYENDVIGTCDASSAPCLHLEYESYYDAVYHPGNPPIHGKQPVTATPPYDFLYNDNRRQGGARVTKIVRSDGLSPDSIMATYHYGEGRVSGVPEAEWPRAVVTIIPPGVPSYHQPSDRGAASVYYTWVEQHKHDGTFTRTHYTTDASCPTNLSCGPQGDIRPQQATFFLRLLNTSVVEGNQHLNWGIPYETVQGVHGQAEEIHSHTLRELALDRGLVALAFDYSDTATVYVDYRLGNAVLERETLLERDENNTLSEVLERVYTYDFGTVDTGMLKRVEETANASRTRVTETTYGHNLPDYDKLVEANIFNAVVRQDAYEQDGASTTYHASTVTTWQRFDADNELLPSCSLGVSDDTCIWKPHRIFRWHASAPAASPASFTSWDPANNPSSAWQLQAKFTDYDAYGHVLKQEDALGRITEFFYGNNNACSNTGEALHHAYLTCVERDALAQTMAYDDRLRLDAIADANADTIRFEYDPFGRFQKTRNAAGEVVGEYVYTTLGVLPQSVETLTWRSDTDTTRAITFYDGLGRAVQTQLKESGTQVIVSAAEFDVQGRDSLGWKPYRLSSSVLDYDSLYAANAQAYYDALYPGSVTPYTETEYTVDGLSRVAKIIPPYTATMASVEQAHSMKLHAGTMYVSSRTTDEDDNMTDVYTDGFGNTVARIAGGGSQEEDTTEFHYDILGNLLTVMPPNSFAPPSGIPSDWETTYQYNTLGQLTSKTTPDTHDGPGGSGKGTFRYAYDAVGNLRFVEDPNRTGNGYLYTEYDAFNRIIETGLCDGGSFTTNPGADSCPSGTRAEVIVYTYDTTTPSEPLAGLTINNPNGRLTQVKFDGDYYQYSYDHEGRVEAMHVYLDGLGDKLMAYAYDRQGNATKVSYQADSVDALYHWYTYDGAGRLEEVRTSLFDDEATANREAHYTYTPTGQVEQLFLGADQEVIPPITYEYHVRDWLTKINDPMSLVGNQFAMALGYETDLLTGGIGRKNGNVSSILWQTQGNVGPTAADTLLGYTFTYDALNRLTAAATQSYRGSWQPVSSYEVPAVQYDPNGNITTLQRLDEAGSGTAITYTYETGRNRLQSVSGGVSASFDYDANGNMTVGRGIDAMDYDRRNLPVFMEAGVDSLRFRYDADGQRVYKQLLNANGSVETFFVREAGGSVVAVYTKTSEGVRWYWNILSGRLTIGRVEPPDDE